MKNIIVPASMLAGTIIGAGVFSLPFVFVNTGLLTSFFYLAVFSSVFICIYFLYADVIVRTSEEHRFVGYSRLYLGKSGFWASLFIGLFQLFFVLAIYLILAPSFFELIFYDNTILYLIIFWLMGSVAIIFNIKRVAILEFLMTFGILAVMAFILAFGIAGFVNSPIEWGNIDVSKFLAVGPILFALSGTLAVPELISYFRESNIPISFVKKSLTVGAIIPAVAYGAFVVGILGLSKFVSEDAVSGLVGGVPAYFLVLIGILGFLSLISSYIIIGVNAKKILQYDLYLPKWLSAMLVIFVPIALYFLGFRDFIKSVSFVGSVFLPLESIFIIFMWINANKKSANPSIFVGRFLKMAIPVLLLVFFISLIYAIIPHS